ncbi:hypothetical protein F11_01220 [Rhodospirillum rubrum F11]|nr:hypothetical protein F11_01220 [Rhodospirillum rubrum F11]
MHVLVADLDEDRAAIGQQVAGDGQAIAQIGQIGVNAIAPCVAEGPDLFGFAGNVILVAVLHIAAGRRPLKIAVEFDAIGRIEIDALHLAAQPFALGQTRHDGKRIAQDHPVGPIGVVLIELGRRLLVGQAVEIGKQIDGRPDHFLGPSPGLALQIVDQNLGVDLFLDIKRRGLNDQFRPIPLVLAPPDQLRVEIAVAAVIGDANGGFHLFLHHRLQFGGGDVDPLRILVGQRLDTDFLGHTRSLPYAAWSATTDAINSLNLASIS